jgi:hypothetical protein
MLKNCGILAISYHSPKNWALLASVSTVTGRQVGLLHVADVSVTMPKRRRKKYFIGVEV